MPAGRDAAKNPGAARKPHRGTVARRIWHGGIHPAEKPEPQGRPSRSYFRFPRIGRDIARLGLQSAAVAAWRVRTKSLFLLGSRCSATRSMISGKVVCGRKFASFSSFSNDGTRRSMSSKPGS